MFLLYLRWRVEEEHKIYTDEHRAFTNILDTIYENEATGAKSGNPSFSAGDYCQSETNFRKYHYLKMVFIENQQMSA